MARRDEIFVGLAILLGFAMVCFSTAFVGCASTKLDLTSTPEVEKEFEPEFEKLTEPKLHYVGTEGLAVRANLSDTARTVKALENGDSVWVHRVSVNGDWAEVADGSTPDSVIGWVSARWLTSSKRSAQRTREVLRWVTMWVLPKRLNVRKGPGTNYEIMGSLKHGERAFVLEDTPSGWSQIDWNGQKYWVYSKHLGTKEELKAKTKLRSNPQDKWLSACMHIYPGVKIYYGDGPRKRYVGEVVNIDDHYADYTTGRSFRAVLLQMSSGNLEWKDRNALISWGYVLRSQYKEAKRRYLGE